MATVSAMQAPKNLLQRTVAAATAAALSVLLAGCVSHLDMQPIGTVQLTGEQEVPAVKTTAIGSGVIKVTSTKMISGSVTTTGINATAAHIHLAPKGSNGPVIVPMTKTGETQTGEAIWAIAQNTRLTDTQYVHYVAGDLYVNVHSEAYPAGEIRGQLLAN